MTEAARHSGDPGRPGPAYLERVLRNALTRAETPPAVRSAAERLLSEPSPVAIEDLSYAIAYHLGIDAAEWDFRTPGAAGTRTERPLVAYLDRVRSPFNVGSIVRTAEAFGFRAVFLGAGCPPLDHPRLIRSAMGSLDFVTVQAGTIEEAETIAGGPSIALETTGIPLLSEPFPLSGVLVVGSEERGIEPALLDRCRRSGGVRSIPLSGAKRSLNVGVAFGIAAVAWAGAFVTG